MQPRSFLLPRLSIIESVRLFLHKCGPISAEIKAFIKEDKDYPYKELLHEEIADEAGLDHRLEEKL